MGALPPNPRQSARPLDSSMPAAQMAGTLVPFQVFCRFVLPLLKRSSLSPFPRPLLPQGAETAVPSSK